MEIAFNEVLQETMTFMSRLAQMLKMKKCTSRIRKNWISTKNNRKWKMQGTKCMISGKYLKALNFEVWTIFIAFWISVKMLAKMLNFYNFSCIAGLEAVFTFFSGQSNAGLLAQRCHSVQLAFGKKCNSPYNICIILLYVYIYFFWCAWSLNWAIVLIHYKLSALSTIASLELSHQ